MAYRTLTIPVGTSAYVPDNAVVIAYSSTGDATLSSDCLDLTQIGQYACYEFAWIVEQDSGGGTGPWNATDIGSASIESIRFKGNIITINTDLIGGGSFFDPISTDNPMIDAIQDEVGDLFQEMALIIADNPGERKQIYFVFKAPTLLVSDLYIQFLVGGSLFRVYAVTSDRCADTEPLPEP